MPDLLTKMRANSKHYFHERTMPLSKLSTARQEPERITDVIGQSCIFTIGTQEIESNTLSGPTYRNL
ncbi:unnamed protein product [Allacma fusca]|uniref:Uncharacterized protein n=1 Tax=Allacma fusca TaxID=39272 RepID=A0A8J2P305_9HEXA|nr:unnamed protein product [Allacma fusca]